MIAYLVINGFSLFDLRKLYIDELFSFYEESFYTLEQMGKIKEGSYAKLVSNSDAADSKNTVNLLRKQLFKSISNAKKKKS